MPLPRFINKVYQKIGNFGVGVLIGIVYISGSKFHYQMKKKKELERKIKESERLVNTNTWD